MAVVNALQSAWLRECQIQNDAIHRCGSLISFERVCLVSGRVRTASGRPLLRLLNSSTKNEGHACRRAVTRSRKCVFPIRRGSNAAYA